MNEHLQVSKGSAAPSFTLKDQDGRNVSLSKFKGKPVVVYFYPADETPGCTKQVKFHDPLCEKKKNPKKNRCSDDLLFAIVVVVDG